MEEKIKAAIGVFARIINEHEKLSLRRRAEIFPNSPKKSCPGKTMTKE